jgi:hypothetical protein
MQEDTKGEKPWYETESFHIRGCIYIVEIKTVHNIANEHNVGLHKMQEFNHGLYGQNGLLASNLYRATAFTFMFQETTKFWKIF